MVYIGGNLESSIGNIVNGIDNKWLRVMGMFLMVVSVICVVVIIMEIMKRRQTINLSTAINAALYISAFVAGFHLWRLRD